MAAAEVAAADAAEDFPGWLLRAHGVNASVARAIESELGIQDSSVLRACVGDGGIRAELLAAARDRLPFGFYAVLRRVVRTLPRSSSSSRSRSSWSDDEGGHDDGGAGAVARSDLRRLVQVLVALLSGLCRELTSTVGRLGSIEGRGCGAAAESDRRGDGVRDRDTVNEHSNAEPQAGMRDMEFQDDMTLPYDTVNEHSNAEPQAGMRDMDFQDDMTLPSDEVGEPTDGRAAHGPTCWGIKIEHQDARSDEVGEPTDGRAAHGPTCWGIKIEHQDARSGDVLDAVQGRAHGCNDLDTVETPSSFFGENQDHSGIQSDFLIQGVTSLQGATKRPLRAARINSNVRIQQQEQQQPQQTYEAAGADAIPSLPPTHPGQFRGQGGTPMSLCAAPQQAQQNPAAAAAAKPFECRQCGRQFAKSIYLTVHTRTHTGEKPYRCKVCGHAFSQVSNMKTHMRMHTGEKPYRCEVCGQAFSQVFGMKTHMRTHTGEKPHRCKLCGQAFSQYSTWKRHLLTHTGEKPYRCEVCGRAFSQSSNMKSHMRTHLDKKT